MSNLRRLINMLIYILLAPVIGHEEASQQIAIGNRKEDKVFINIIRRLRAGAISSSKTIEEELITISKNLELSGVEPTMHFEYLQMKVTDYISNLKKRYSDLLSAMLTGVIGLFMFSIMMSLFTDSLILKIFFMLIPLVFLINVHVNQLEVIKYNYVKPLIISTAMSCIIILILYVSHIIVISSLDFVKYFILTFSLLFSIFYIPQLSQFIGLIVNINNRIIRPIHELLWNPTGVKIRGSTVLEKEIERFVELGRSICSPWFISRISRLVDSLVDLIRSSVRSSILYGMFIPVGFILVMYSLAIFTKFTIPSAGYMYNNLHNIPMILSLLNMYSRSQIRILRLIGSVVTSLVTGKTIHSIGLGICLIPLMFLLCRLIC